MTSGVAQTTEVKKSIRSQGQKFLGHPKVTEELDRLAILYNKTKEGLQSQCKGSKRNKGFSILEFHA